MTIVGEYLKSKVSNLIVKVTGINPTMHRVSAIVIVPIATKHIGKEIRMLHPAYFTKYEPTPQELIEWGEIATLTNDNLNKVEVDEKDVLLRLECLKLAATINQGTSSGSAAVIFDASEIYKWLTVPQ